MKNAIDRSLRRAPARTLTTAAAAARLPLAMSPHAFAASVDPYAMDDESWVTLSGKVESVTKDRFTLDYGDNQIVVEMDDYDRDAEAYNLVRGDEVTVTGKIDDDFFEATTVEASAVYVRNLNTTFFASAVDEEDRALVATYVTVPLESPATVFEGRIASIDGDEFVLDTGVTTITVETDELDDNPFDDEGYLRLNVGDDVKVIGEIDKDLFEGREIEAESIVKLYGRSS